MSAISRALVERDALKATVAQLQAALVKCAVPYEALLMDAESRRWIAPTVWALIEVAVKEIREQVATTTPREEP